MGFIRTVIHGFGVGIVDVDNATRIDLERMRLAAEEQENLIGTVTGKGFFRGGLGYIGSSRGDAECLLKEFVFSSDDAALLEFSEQRLRVYLDDTLITRPSVSTAITSGGFSVSTGWTLDPETGATAVISGGFLTLNVSSSGMTSKARQEVTVSVGDAGTEHALEIVIERGPVSFMCGSSSGADDYIELTSLNEGRHSLSFTPTGNFWVEFQSDAEMDRKVNSIVVASAGVMEIVTPWALADLETLRFDQSADVIFVAYNGQQYRVERRSSRSWSVAKYFASDGPFIPARTAKVRLKPSVTRNNGTLTSNKPFFSEDHIGALFYLFHDGQYVIQNLSSDYTYTDPIKVTGVYTDAVNDRNYVGTVAGTWTGTLVRQRSFDDESYGFKTISDYTGGFGATNFYDNDDNAIIYYRFGFVAGHTSGTAQITIEYDGGGDYGICRVVGYNSQTSVDMEVLRPFKRTIFTDDWKEGAWSARQDWPTSVALAEGRLFWGGSDKWWGSVSDAYESFDDEVEGDSGPLDRTIAVGGVNNVQWMASVKRLIIGTNNAEVIASSSSLDEPLTPTNATLRAASTIGCAPIAPCKIDNRLLFTDRSAKAIFEMAFGSETGDYQSNEITRLCARLFSSGIKQMAVQRRPDTRVWVILENGNTVCIVYEPSQEVIAFILVTTDGDFESVAVLPGIGEDRVYFSVNRTINAATVRYIEKMATDEEAKPNARAYVMDSYTSGVQSPADTIILVGTHLAGKYVKVWGDGLPYNETVDGRVQPKLFLVGADGNVTVDRAVTLWVAGLPYKARYKSGRLAYGATQGTPLLSKQKVDKLGIVMTDCVRSGVSYGNEFDNNDRMFPLRTLRDGVTPDDVEMDVVIDEEPFVFPSGWTLDERVCIELQWPCSLLALTYDVQTNG